METPSSVWKHHRVYGNTHRACGNTHRACGNIIERGETLVSRGETSIERGETWGCTEALPKGGRGVAEGGPRRCRGVPKLFRSKNYIDVCRPHRASPRWRCPHPQRWRRIRQIRHSLVYPTPGFSVVRSNWNWSRTR